MIETVYRKALRCRSCGSDWTGGRCKHCGQDEFLDIAGFFPGLPAPAQGAVAERTAPRPIGRRLPDPPAR